MELLVRIIDRSQREDDSHRGDVIAVVRDGWEWSQIERTNPDWLILKVGGLLDTDADTMLTHPINLPFGRFRRREWKLDLDNAPLPARFTHPRRQESVSITRLALVSMLTRKPALA